MDPAVPSNAASRPTRPLTRSSVKVVSVELTPRPPLKRPRGRPVRQTPAAAVNGCKEAEDDSDDEPPSKKSPRVASGGAVHGGSEGDPVDVPEMEEEMDISKAQEMDEEEEPLRVVQKLCPSPVESTLAMGDINLAPLVILERCGAICNEDLKCGVNKTTSGEPSTKKDVTSTKHAPQLRAPQNRPKCQVFKQSSMVEYKEKMESRVKTSDIGVINHNVTRVYPPSVLPYTTRRPVRNIPATKQLVHLKIQDGKRNLKVSGSHGPHSRGFFWYFWRLVFLLLLSAATLLAYKNVAVLRGPADIEEDSSVKLKPEEFATQLAALHSQFPNQHADLWKRSRIHLEKHLENAQPKEPVSLILTAGRRAERTLLCLAQGLASAFSSALNASVLHIDGASKAHQDSDQVKLDIDSQLRGAFEGDKPVAVIHRFEELPPGSTLIFYRYCDHENAAYKGVFLAFTVLLPQEDLEPQLTFKEVEETVQEYIKVRFVGSSSKSTFNSMDADKLSGLWSRISHLILPVAAESEVEENGC